MSKFKVGDVAIVTGSLQLANGSTLVYLDDGDVVDIIEDTDEEGDILVQRRSDGKRQFIYGSSLTPFSEIQADPEVEWGDPTDADYVRYQGVHDYVYQGEEE